MDFSSIYQNLEAALAIIGILLAIYFGFKSMKKKKPVYIKNNQRLITKKVSAIPQLVVSFYNQEIENLSLMSIKF